MKERCYEGRRGKRNEPAVEGYAASRNIVISPSPTFPRYRREGYVERCRSGFHSGFTRISCPAFLCVLSFLLCAFSALNVYSLAYAKHQNKKPRSAGLSLTQDRLFDA
jgi:hypothetical protein